MKGLVVELQSNGLMVDYKGSKCTISKKWFGESQDTIGMLSEALFNCYEYGELTDDISTNQYKTRYKLHNKLKNVFGDLDKLWFWLEGKGYF